MLNLVIISSPGVDIFIQSSIIQALKERFNIVDFSPYDLLKEELSKGSHLGDLLKAEMGGWLLTYEQSLKLLDNKLKTTPCLNGFLFVNFIDLSQQAEQLDTVLTNNGLSKPSLCFLTLSYEESLQELYKNLDKNIGYDEVKSDDVLLGRIKRKVQKKRKKIEDLAKYYKDYDRLFECSAHLTPNNLLDLLQAHLDS